MNPYRKMQYLIVLACLVLLLAGCGPGQMLGPTLTPTPEPTPTLTAGEQARALAEAGVTRNADWTPYTEEINDVLMVLVPAGCFQMGSTDAQVEAAFQQCEQEYGLCDREWFEAEQPAHEVCFEEPFWIDVYEVTQAQFAELGGEAGYASSFTGDNLPRESITWMEADAFCRKRNARLPTEAEWEYAARGPDGLVYPWGNEFVADNVVYSGDSMDRTSAVGSKPGGISWIGAYDLSGNVWEWVSNWYGEYPAGREVNPQGPESGHTRVLRGGSWYNYNINNPRAANRDWGYPDLRYDNYGFRCALSYVPKLAGTPHPTKTPVPASPPTPTPTPTASAQQARALAEAGVTRNADWTPYTEEVNGVPMALVPAGCFMMGSTDAQVEAAFQQCEQEYDQEYGLCDRGWLEAEQPAHEVCFEEPFWIDVYEVTQAQFAELGGEARSASYSTGDNRPRESIAWMEADAFCRKRNARLPTEAEWEYAARGPDGLVYPWGNDFVVDNAVYFDNTTWDVGSKPGGISWIGAYDLSGNVWEWVNDWYSETYFGTLADGVVNPQGPGSGSSRVLRGGSWSYCGPSYLRAAGRSWYEPGFVFDDGFRCARS